MNRKIKNTNANGEIQSVQKIRKTKVHGKTSQSKKTSQAKFTGGGDTDRRQTSPQKSGAHPQTRPTQPDPTP